MTVTHSVMALAYVDSTRVPPCPLAVGMGSTVMAHHFPQPLYSMGDVSSLPWTRQECLAALLVHDDQTMMNSCHSPMMRSWS